MPSSSRSGSRIWRAYSTARIASPVFYALGQSRVPVAAGTASIAFNIVASVALVRAAGFRGLALSTSLAALANGGLLLLLLRRRLQGIDGARLASAFVKMLLASLVMAAVAVVAERGLTGLVPGRGLLVQSSRLVAAIGAGLAGLVVSAKILRIQEFTQALSFMRDRARKLLG